MKELILSILLFDLLLDVIVETLNLKSFPDHSDFLTRKSYLTDHLKLKLLEQSTHLGFWFLMFHSNLLNSLDQWLVKLMGSTAWQGALWLFMVGALKEFVSLPFQVWSTFLIEARYGFNTTTVSIFILDRIKGAFVSLIIGAPLLAGVLMIFEKMGISAWWMSWIGITLFSWILSYIAPSLLLPLFNKFEPLPKGELRSKIERYANHQGFPIRGTFMMDGSKRSTKRNAFFTGFGKTRKLVLFDTLLENHSSEEILAIVAHEMGHYKLGHIPKMIFASTITQGVLLWTLGRFITDHRAPGWTQQTLGFSEPRLAGTFLIVSLLYIPISRVFSLIALAVSRKQEFEADEYSKKTFGDPEALIAALKKMETDHLSHPSPHRLKVILEYSHPPVSERERALKN